MAEPHYNNTLLMAVGRDAIERLGLRPVQFKVGQELEFPGKPIRNLFFLEEGMASMTTTFANGNQVEVGMFGYESVIGFSALMGTKLSLNRVYTQVAGWGYACKFDVARREFELHGVFERMALRYVQTQLLQTMQSAGCNATHEVEQRLARWLLLCADRVRRDEFKMSQEFLSHMLGSSRPTVTMVAGHLRDEGLIEYVRSTIRIVDRFGLERRACECYGVVKKHLDDFAAFETSRAASQTA